MSFASILGHAIILTGYVGLILLVLKSILDIYIFSGWYRVIIPNLIGSLLIFWFYFWLTNGMTYVNWIKGA